MPDIRLEGSAEQPFRRGLNFNLRRRHLDPHGFPMLIAQLSDIHVRPSGELYKGLVDSNRMFLDAIEHLEQLDQRPDLVMITGDLVDDGDPREYRTVVDLLQTLTIPYLVLPGNHDRRDALLHAFESHTYLPTTGPLNYCIDTYPLRIVALDSCLRGKHEGALEPSSLDWLQSTLAADRTKPTLIVLHHPPFVSGIPYLDTYRFIDHRPLEAIVSSCDNIEAVLCGHVHRPMFRRWAKTVVAACPSTTTQIALQFQARASPKSYQGPASCLLHIWNPEHGLISHVSYIGKYPGPYAFF